MEYKYQTCPICKSSGVWELGGTHRCPPKWEYCIPDNDPEEWIESYNYYSETVAEKAAEEYDCDGDYYLVRDSNAELQILVRKFGSTEIEEFNVTAESIPKYFASFQGIIEKEDK